jgi:hypothetical protein
MSQFHHQGIIITLNPKLTDEKEAGHQINKREIGEIQIIRVDQSYCIIKLHNK